MKRTLLQAVFVITVFVFWMIALIPGMSALEVILPTGSTDRLLPGLLVAFACLWVADRGASLLFRAARISDERWTIFSPQRPRTRP